MAFLYDGTKLIQPDLVLGWDQARESRTQVHPILARSDPEVTLRPSATRTGRLQLFFLTMDAAVAASDAMGLGHVWQWDDPGNAPRVEALVVSGPVALHADGPNLNRWVVEVDYTEVAAP